jgi:hypothetical protein
MKMLGLLALLLPAIGWGFDAEPLDRPARVAFRLIEQSAERMVYIQEIFSRSDTGADPFTYTEWFLPQSFNGTSHSSAVIQIAIDCRGKRWRIKGLGFYSEKLANGRLLAQDTEVQPWEALPNSRSTAVTISELACWSPEAIAQAFETVDPPRILLRSTAIVFSQNMAALQ